MSGHSKWSTIKNKKEKTDSARAKIFTKIGREICVAVKAGGPDVANNNKLKDVVLKAKANNVPNSNIERMIKKASGKGDKTDFYNIVYEGYGPEGVAVLVSALTDNKNRTAANVRHYFDKYGGKLGTNGSVSFLFSKKGVFYLKIKEKKQEELFEFCLNLNVLDFEYEDEIAKITVESEKFSFFVEKFKEKNYEFLDAAVEEVPSSFVEIKDEENIKKMEKLIEIFEEDEDINEVWTNCKNL